MKIFLSYSHKNRTEADSIDQFFRDRGYTILRDIREVTYKGDLFNYCDRIRECRAAITLVSKAYLKSRWCIYEVLQLMKEQQFKEKIFPVILDDAAIFEPGSQIEYIKYWNEEYRKYESNARNMELSQSAETATDLKLLSYIKLEIGSFIATLARWLLLPYNELMKNDFLEITRVLGPPPETNYRMLTELMAAKIREDLKKKLYDTHYIPMELEYGILPEKKDREQGPKSMDLMHGRKWQQFNLKELLPIRKKYILSSSVGMGKTTFVRHLAGQLLEMGYLPLVFSCREFEEKKPNTANQLISYFAEMYNQYSQRKLKQETILDILKTHDKKIIFLFDGLDQIVSDKYGFIAGEIEKACYGYYFIVTSRPSAIYNLESDKEYIFLRLQLFSQKALEDFFGDQYEEAKALTFFAPDLIRTPMLAYMVMKLMEEETVLNIRTRTELYEKFVNYIFREHPKQNKQDYQFTKAMNIKKNIRKIAYTALALEKPQIQKISLEHCYEQLDNITCEDLATYGLVNLALEKSDFLYFTHQSFQEYFAACYVKENREYEEEVIARMWNPKWKEVIKFLAGLSDVDFLEKIYSGTDNAIHSRLFLASECVSEMREKEGEYREKLEKELNDIPYIHPFKEAILKAQIACNNTGYILELLHDKDRDSCMHTIYALGNNGGYLPEAIITGIKELVYEEDCYISSCAAYTLVRSGENIPETLIGQLVELVSFPDTFLRKLSCETLKKIGKNLPEAVLNRLMEKFRDYNNYSRWDTLEILIEIGKYLPEMILNRLGEALHDQDKNIRSITIIALEKIGGNLPEGVYEKLEELLYDTDYDVCIEAARILLKISRSTEDGIFARFMELLCDKDNYIRTKAAEALENIGMDLPESIINQLVVLLHDPESNVSITAAAVLAKTKMKIREEIINRLMELLYDPEDNSCIKAARILLKICGNRQKAVYDRLTELLYKKNSDIYIDAASTLLDNGVLLPEDSITILADVLNEKESFNRFRAVETLGMAGSNLPDAIIRRMAELLYDKEPYVRVLTMEVLGKIVHQIPEDLVVKIGQSLHDESYRLINYESYRLLKQIYEAGKFLPERKM